MSEEDPGGQRRVIVCGSEEQIADRVASVLPDWQIERVPDNQSALLAIAARPADLLLTGRETSGREDVCLLRQIRQLQPDPHLRVVIVTSEGTREDVIAAMRNRAFSYFSRPYFEAAFDEILRHASSGAPWEDSIRVDSATPAWLRVVARCELSTADRVIQFMNEISDLDGQDRDSMGFALKEIVMNAMDYGGEFNRDRFVEVSYVRGQRMILYRVRDPGHGFSLDELSHAAISNPPEEPVRHLDVRESMGIRPGGFGVMLSRKLVDDLIYSEQGNDVLLIKYLDPPTPEPQALDEERRN